MPADDHDESERTPRPDPWAPPDSGMHGGIPPWAVQLIASVSALTTEVHTLTATLREVRKDVRAQAEAVASQAAQFRGLQARLEALETARVHDDDLADRQAEQQARDAKTATEPHWAMKAAVQAIAAAASLALFYGAINVIAHSAPLPHP